MCVQQHVWIKGKIPGAGVHQYGPLMSVRLGYCTQEFVLLHTFNYLIINPIRGIQWRLLPKMNNQLFGFKNVDIQKWSDQSK